MSWFQGQRNLGAEEMAKGSTAFCESVPLVLGKSCTYQEQRSCLSRRSLYYQQPRRIRRRNGVVLAFHGDNNKQPQNDDDKVKVKARAFRKKRRRRKKHHGRGADTILVELLRFWLRNCDVELKQENWGIRKRLPGWLGGIKSDEEDEDEFVEEVIEDAIHELGMEQAILNETFEMSGKTLDPQDMRGGGTPGVSYAEFPLTLRMGLSVNSDRLASKFVVLVADLLCDLIVWDIFHKVHSVEDLGRVLTGASLAYIFGDLVSGVYHWVRHNFDGFSFDPDHNHDAEDVVCLSQEKCEERKKEATKDFYRTVATHCLASVPFLAVLWISPHSDLTMQSFGVYLITIVSILPALRQWASSASPPKAVSVLQRAGLMLRKSEKAFSDVEYCILSGLWNNLLSTTKFFTRLEHLIVYMTQGKIVPRSWNSKSGGVVPNEEGCGECDGDQIASGSSSDTGS